MLISERKTEAFMSWRATEQIECSPARHCEIDALTLSVDVWLQVMH